MLGFVPDLVVDFFDLLVDSGRISTVLSLFLFELLEFVFEFVDACFEVFRIVVRLLPTKHLCR
ncbi:MULTISPECIES: hypothetical protein [Haloferacaceae]|uniref:Uncharacterized protein n=1 Tax=Halorubrum glutamatedens TaxID=2707018 RepID=A0ABD5QQ80_9EURY|nr:hypothetical protein [Halobellus captivus]